MESFILTASFVAAVLLSTLMKFWLASRQMRHVAQHRPHVPEAFASTVSLQAHQRAADYTLAKGQLGLLTTAFSAAVLIGWTLLGGLDQLNTEVFDLVHARWGPMAYQLTLLVAFMAISSLLELPFELYATFGIEEKFGFNRMSWKLYVWDMLKGLLLGAIIGLPLIALILWIMSATGATWWLWAWTIWVGFSLLMMVLIPTVIAPLFNQFKPLSDEALKQRAQALMTRCGFTAKGFYVMDGSKRSNHGNAYFTGVGAAKRVVFFDTLLDKLNPGEVEAVLAHELGHFKHRHLTQQLLMMSMISLLAFALLGWLSNQSWFYTSLGVQPHLAAPHDALALLLFMLVLPAYSYFVSPLMAQLSRKHEFQADAYACAHASAQDLGRALLKLHEDNAATLTPDPIYARFYYSHPPAAERLAALRYTADSHHHLTTAPAATHQPL